MKKICFIISKNDFETFNKMLILGTTGAAMNVKMWFFFTFWGLKLVKKEDKPRVADPTILFHPIPQEKTVSDWTLGEDKSEEDHRDGNNASRSR
jgi:peroxiredoxin family protein